MKNFIPNYLKKIILIASTFLAFSAHADEDRYDKVSATLESARLSATIFSSKAQTASQKPEVSATVFSSDTSAKLSQAMFEALTYLDEVARSGRTDDLTIERAQKVAEYVGMTFFVMLNHRGIELENTKRNLTSVEKALGVMKEMMYDASRIVSFRKDPAGKRVWGVTSTIAQERLSQETAEKIGQFVDNTVSALDEKSFLREDFLLKFNFMMEKYIHVKTKRASQQKIARYAYLGLAIATFLHPPVDLVFERTYYSSFYSSIIYMSSFMTLFALKTKMASTKTIEILMQVANDIKNPKQAVERMRANQSNAAAMTCEGMF